MSHLPLRSISGHPILIRVSTFLGYGVPSWGADPLLRACTSLTTLFEEDDISLEVAFDAFGTVKSVKKQTCVSNPNIFNGTKLVNIVLSGVLPRFLIVED